MKISGGEGGTGKLMQIAINVLKCNPEDEETPKCASPNEMNKFVNTLII